MVNIVAAIQMNSSGTVKANLASAGTLIAAAVKQKAALVVLPEMFPIMTLQTKDKLAAAEDYGSGPIQEFLAQTARQHGIWLVSGTIPIRQAETERARATCLVFNAVGEVVARYDKMHLFDVVVSEQETYQESDTVAPGEAVAVVAPTPFGKLGLAVCYDIRFPELFRVMFNQGAEIFAIPTAFTIPTGRAHWETLVRSRAIENLSYVIGACQVGEHAGNRQTYGHSLIVDPWGEVLAMRPAGVGVITAEINLEQLHEIRKRMPVAQHQRIFTTK